MLLALLEKRLSADCVESVGEVNFDENAVRVVAMALTPLPSGLETNLCAERLAHPYLEGEEEVQGGTLVLKAQ